VKFDTGTIEEAPRDRRYCHRDLKIGQLATDSFLDRKSKSMPTDDAKSGPAGPLIKNVVGVDFSGAALSGRTAWVAFSALSRKGGRERLNVTQLSPLGVLAGDDSRAVVNQFLVDAISRSTQTLWGIDFPFGLPLELELGNWRRQLSYLASYPGTAKDFGRHLVQRAQSLGHAMHVRRQTDRETQTPFDCYHYRIIYQTFHGMRDVLLPLAKQPRTCVMPFQYSRFANALRYVVEACPSSTLKRMKLPHRLYKQSGGKPPTDDHKRVRRVILDRLTHPTQGCVNLKAEHVEIVMTDSGGDAMDAVIAAVGTHFDFRFADHASIRRHDRYPREGRVSC
jgi:hypothetical protein